jgi:hypothetical protein
MAGFFPHPQWRAVFELSLRIAVGRGVTVMNFQKLYKSGLLVALAVAALAFPALSHAQSCALCYTQAASSGSRIIQALRSGILMLVIPPAFLSVGITWLAYRKRNQFTNPERSAESDQTW